MYTMFRNEDGFTRLLSMMQKIELVQVTHKKYASTAVYILCGISLLASILIPVLGLDAVHFIILKQDGWSLLDVFLQREYVTVQAFTKLRAWNENGTSHMLNTGITNSSDWTPLTIMLGGIGTICAACTFLIDNAVIDLLLSTTIMLVVITKGMKLDEGNQHPATMNLAETETLFKDMIKRFKILTEISDCMNAVVGKLIPCLVLVNGLGIVSMVNQILNENWSDVFVYMFTLIKGGAAMYMAATITTEVIP